MGYSAGTLDLSILGTSNEAIASIDKTVKSLNSLSRIINKINKTDWGKVNSGFSKLTVSLTPFINKINEAQASLVALNNILSKTSKISNIIDNSSKPSKFGGLSSLFKLGKWTAVLYTARRIGRVFGNIVTKGSDFGETLNLWQVSMGQEFLPMATEFVNKLNEAYGISKKTLMNSQAIFKNMLGSLGQISEQTAYRLSEGITQMALDYASLYNVKFADAMTKFQAALAGQVRPIRSVAGYDITENTLFQLYQTLGGTKTMRQLSRTEKQLLSIYAVFQQMSRSGAIGDLDRTLNSFANQSRVMKDAWEDVMTYAGLVTTRLLEQYSVMKYINAILIFAGRLLEGIAHSLDSGNNQGGLLFEDIEDGANDAKEATEQLKESLLDFDKFRALNSDNRGIEGALRVDKNIIDGISQYDSILQNANLEARELADSWLKSLGLIDLNKDGIVDIQNGILDINNLINSIDWSKLGANAGEFWANIPINLQKIIEDIDWKALGVGIGEFINNADWGTIIIESLKLISKLAEGLATAIFNALKSIDWFQLFQEILVKPLDRLLQDLGIYDMGKDFFGTWFDTSSWWSGYAQGGLPDKGTMFVAGEAGAEMVYNMPSGQSGVANISQIKQAMYQAMVEYGRTQNTANKPVVVYLDGEIVYQNTTSHAQQHGNIWANA